MRWLTMLTGSAPSSRRKPCARIRPAREPAQARAARTHAPDSGGPSCCTVLRAATRWRPWTGAKPSAAAIGASPCRRDRSARIRRCVRRHFPPACGCAACRARAASAMDFRRGPSSAVARHLRRNDGRDPRLGSTGLRCRSRPAAGGVRREAMTPPPAGWARARPSCAARQQAARPSGSRPNASPGSTASPCRSPGPVQEQGRELRNWWVEEMLGHRPAADRAHGAVLAQPLHLGVHEGAFPARAVPARTLCSASRRSAILATLLKSVARDPAMLIYLDGMRSVARQPQREFRPASSWSCSPWARVTTAKPDIKQSRARSFHRLVDRPRERPFHQPRPAARRPARRPSSARAAASAATRSSPSCSAIRAPPKPSSSKLWREFVSLRPDPAEVKAARRVVPQGLRAQAADARDPVVGSVPRFPPTAAP